MIVDQLLLIIGLLFCVSMLSMLSEKLHIPYPIFLVIAGLLISIIPGMPVIKLDPNLVFLIFLPPLLYAAAWNTSWHEFWSAKRPISMLSFGLVIFTSGAVAFAAHAMIPGFSLAMGFLLGGIISPPDAIAATSIIQKLKVPKRVVTILEGESLVNDASSLIVFRFALAAISTGQFVFWNATGDFFLVVIMGILIGVAIAHIIYALHRFLPTTPSIDTAITLISPYLMYITAEHFHFSGVLAVVSGGLFLTFRSHEIFSYDTRLQAISVWQTLVFLLNGIVFILIGLQLPEIIKGLDNYSITEAITYAVVISLLTIVIRLLWVYPGAYIPRFLFKGIREKEANPGWKLIFITGWSGMRGLVSLASALAVPLVLNDGTAFPHRNLILFITFVVILFTLVLQGLSLPWIIRKLGIESTESPQQQEREIRYKLAVAVLKHLINNYSDETENIEAYKRVKERYERMVEIAEKKLDAAEVKDEPPSFLPNYYKMLYEMIEVRRAQLNEMRNSKLYSDELLREKERELDLEEARIRK
ncbi:Na+/H+ antiporter [Panacibacter ginsenosidivorans]|uniref:Na+/H+ antiporter n=1 Tax=Panacibacter ginsenosidivorans TaxID=1813871 RepID=A0A5B8VAT9_9BACT|nr:Na+/H+ antiporter [Panacibacter ginsenosidivorans]QEC68083.1 Na+/H+ antiporter [Panacibacter ginsenosidivorans]